MVYETRRRHGRQMASTSAYHIPSFPMTPPDPVDSSPKNASVASAIHVLSTERAALAHLEQLYQTDQLAQENLARAVDQIVQCVGNGGKLVFSGVGKSGKIAQKLEATMNSVGVLSTFLHPTEALHGDLGIIRPNDTLIMISFSGRTSELLLLLPHIPQTVPIIAITSHAHPATCPLLSFHHPDMGILLPAPIHENEESSLGVSAPTSSTTVALSLGDALAIAAARRIHTSSDRGPAEVFKSLHPGGAIGAAAAAAAAATNPSTATTPMSMSAFSFNSSGYLETRPALSSTSSDQDEHRPLLLTDCISTPPVPLHHIPIVSAPAGTRLLDVLLTAIQHPDAKSWVFLSDNEVVPPRHTRSLCRSGNVDLHVSEFAGLPFAIHRKDWVHVSVSSTVDEVRARLKRLGPDSSAVVAVVKESSSDVLGVLEGGDFW